MSLSKIKNYFFGTKTPKEPEVPQSWSTGERDEKGFAKLYVDGVETKINMLVWTQEEVERLHRIQEKIEKENE